jgi:hypothetical protein
LEKGSGGGDSHAGNGEKMPNQENVGPALSVRPEKPGYHININRKTNNSELKRNQEKK